MVISVTKVRGNIFEEFAEVKQMIMESTTGVDSVYDEEYVKLCAAIEKYFKSMRWARSGKEVAVYRRSGKGLKTSVIADALGMNHNSYRSMVSTVSKRLRDLMFDGEDMSEAILGADRDKVIRLRKHIEYLTLSFDFYGLYSDVDLMLIGRWAEPRDEYGEPTEEEMFTALLVLVMMNERTREYRLKTLNPKALRKVVDELTKDKYSDWIRYYELLGVGSKPVASEGLIQRLKQSVN